MMSTTRMQSHHVRGVIRILTASPTELGTSDQLPMLGVSAKKMWSVHAFTKKPDQCDNMGHSKQKPKGDFRRISLFVKS